MAGPAGAGYAPDTEQALRYAGADSYRVTGLAFKLSDRIDCWRELGITCAPDPYLNAGCGEGGRRHFRLAFPFKDGPTRGNGIFRCLLIILSAAPNGRTGAGVYAGGMFVGRTRYYPAVQLHWRGEIRRAGEAGAYAHIRRQ